MPYFGNNPSPLLLNTVAQNGKEMTLDADADTSITADTDDQIDIKIGGADDFQFTANTFTAQSGSTIAAQALTATTITASSTVTNNSTTTLNDDVTFTGANYNVTWDKSANDLTFGDNAKLNFGAGDDLQIYHTPGTGSFIDEAGDGALFIRSSRVTIHKYTGETMINAAADGAVSLYYDDVKVIETVSGGVEISGTLDMDGTELILDADGDTSITADTDDRIDFRFGGTDSVHMDVSGVGVNVTNPLYPLHVNAASGGDTAALFLEGPNNGYSALYMGDTDDVDRSMILYGHANDEWKLFVGANKSLEIDGTNRTIIFEMAAGSGNINAYNNNIYLKSTAGEVYATDSAGNHTLLSPHNFKYLPDGKSEDNAWAYMSEKTIPTKETVTEELPNGKSITKEVIRSERKDGDEFTYVNVDMMKVVREVEKLTGTKLVYSGTNGKDDGSTVKDDIIAGLIKRIEVLESK